MLQQRFVKRVARDDKHENATSEASSVTIGEMDGPIPSVLVTLYQWLGEADVLA